MRLSPIFFLGAFFVSFGSPTWLSDPYDEVLGHRMFYYAEASYCEGASIEKWYCAPCLKLKPEERLLSPTGGKVLIFRWKSSFFGGLQAYAGVSSDRSLVIALRGTDNWANLWKDIDSSKVPFKDRRSGEVHQGFYEAYGHIRDYILSAVKSVPIGTSVQQVLVAGHSLGGAMATLLVDDLVYLRLVVGVPIKLYTFGSPRVGNKPFVERFSGQARDSSIQLLHWRVVWKADPVPHLPPHIFNFYHVPREVWYKNDKPPPKTCNMVNEDPNCSYGLWHWRFSDHAMLTYSQAYKHLKPRAAKNAETCHTCNQTCPPPELEEAYNKFVANLTQDCCAEDEWFVGEPDPIPPEYNAPYPEIVVPVDGDIPDGCLDCPCFADSPPCPRDLALPLGLGLGLGIPIFAAVVAFIGWVCHKRWKQSQGYQSIQEESVQVE